jgi:HAE1 family hydrophobic/amphiphilic exporter-1
MRFVDGCIKRPVTVLMAVSGVAIFGCVAASRLAVDLLPDISYPSLTIRTDVPDAAPEDVEQFVTRPVEEGVGVVAGLTHLHSVSRAGQSEVTLEFTTGTRMDLASLAVREKLDLVNLPREVKRPAILRFDPALDPILRLRLSGGSNLQRLRRVAEHTVKSDLEGAPGVAAVHVVGGEEEEIHVEVDAARLSSVGLTLQDIGRRLAEENINLAGGSLTEGSSEYLVRVANQFASPSDIGSIVLAARPEGIVRLSDVATVARGGREREVIARVNGRESVEISIYKEGDANTVSVARAVKSRLERLQLPADMHLVTVADQSQFIEEAIHSVIEAALIGSLLSILVIFGFLRDLRSTIIISLSIPVSVFATFVIMYRLGLSLNLMSLGGLAMGVGMLVDDSIVVLESIWRKRQEHPGDLRRAAASGAGIVAMAVTASTLTTVVVFLPLVFVEGLAGQLIRDQALTISFSLLASLGVALALVPTIAALSARKRRAADAARSVAAAAGAPMATTTTADGETPASASPPMEAGAPASASTSANTEVPASASRESSSPPALPPQPVVGSPRGDVRRGRSGAIARWVVFALVFLPRLLVRALDALGRRMGPVVNVLVSPIEIAYQFLLRTYPRVVRGALARPGRVLAGAACLLLAAIATIAFLPKNLIPTFAQGEFHFDVRLPEGTALEVTDTVLDRVAGAVRDDPHVRFAYTSVGQTNLAEFAGAAREANRGQVAVVLRRANDRRGEEEVASKLRAALNDVPGARYELGRPSLLTFRSPIEVDVYAHDLDTLRVLSDLVATRLASVRGVQDVESSVRSGDPEVQIAFDRVRLASWGLDPAAASRLVRNAVQGDAATQFSDLDRKIDVRVRASALERSAVTDLARLEVGRNAGEAVPLASVASVNVTRGPGEIRRIGQQRAAVVSANLKGRDLGSASRDILAILSELSVPPGARVSLAGQNEELAQSFASLRLAILLAIFLVYLVMASQFESLLHPFVIMFTLPLAVIGVVLTLVLTHTAVSVMVLIGMLVLSGIVVKNAIILVDYTNRLRDQGLSKHDALVEAGTIRLRPILMTTLCTVLGLLPLAIGIGQGAEVGAPLALTIMGGLAFATVLTLIVIPVVYATLDHSA